ncbi:hypothetical protein N177_2457 [Lutibaculum baratangense AMV1]|uniref:Uncharacterized protein n=1 Tax=Lutibaculum baratangense AMV1 TaxID=631454 RepID=V4RDW1_9HYPH|nr:hypothetical protein N177_2457 [Lutibaculum baratangense AMV1]
MRGRLSMTSLHASPLLPTAGSRPWRATATDQNRIPGVEPWQS